MLSHRTHVIAAWSVHALTLTGVIWATLAMLSLFANQHKFMWLYLGIALIVDGVDGSLARRANVKKYAPNFDGVILDCVVDYLTWTFIPALFMYRTGLLGEGIIAVVLLSLINVTSMFCYANTKMKTDDYYFMGFPAAWNIVAITLWLAQPSPLANAIIVVFFSVMTWAPITFVHPFRVKNFMVVNVIATIAWVITSGVLVAYYPVQIHWAFIIWVIAGLWIVAIGLVRTVTATRAQRAAIGAETDTVGAER
jgi:phosphatidylcholine synthase